MCNSDRYVFSGRRGSLTALSTTSWSPSPVSGRLRSLRYPPESVKKLPGGVKM